MKDYIHIINKKIQPFNAALIPYALHFMRVTLPLMSITASLKELPIIATTNAEKGAHIGICLPIALILTELIAIPSEFKDPYNLLIRDKLSSCSMLEHCGIGCSILLTGLLGRYIGRKFDAHPLPGQLQN